MPPRSCLRQKTAPHKQQLYRLLYLMFVSRATRALAAASARDFTRQHQGSGITSSRSVEAAFSRDSSTLCALRGGGSSPSTAWWCWRGRNHTTAASQAHPAKPEAVTRKFRFRVYLAVGSNLGDRSDNLRRALTLLCTSERREPTIRVTSTSFLHETAPMYVTDQPAFLNGAVAVETDLEPHELLRRIKVTEAELGRDFNTGIRNGPRPVDLDILLYEEQNESVDGTGTCSWKPLQLDTPDLVIPHVRIQEREFVLAPLCEVAGHEKVHPVFNETIGDLFSRLQSETDGQEEPPAVRVIPLPRGRMLHLNETVVMGILNVTPDSFSDGGQWSSSVEQAAHRALEMEREGAGIIDIGGESTRPGAEEISIDEELHRTISVIERIRQESDVPISIDTRRAPVARAAVDAGADIVNDVSGGMFDPSMLTTVSELGVPLILMHMRGTPTTMQSMTEYDDVVRNVAMSLAERSAAAELAGIPKWMIVLDPGIGFAKDLRGNLLLLKGLPAIRTMVGNAPLLLGTSRKRFIGEVAGVEDAKDRDPGTIASTVAALCIGQGSGDCSIVRVHNVAAVKQGTMVMDAIRNAN